MLFNSTYTGSGGTLSCAAKMARRSAALTALLGVATGALAQGGNIYLTGHDTLQQEGQNGYDQVVLDLLRCKDTPDEIPASSYRIAVIGSSGGNWDWSGPFIAAYPAPVFINADALTTAASWGPVLETTSGSGLPKYNAIVVLSHTSCAGCSLTTTGSNNLNLAGPLIRDLFSEEGMDIWANAGAQLSTYYDFLPTGLVSSTQGTVYPCTTAAGVAIGLTPPMTTYDPNNMFAAFSPLLTVSEKSCRSGHAVSLYAKNISLLEECVPPPRNMVLWMPFDETTGNTASNIVGPSDGVVVGGVDGDGKVGDGQPCYPFQNSVTVANYPAINPGLDDFSIDAWVYTDIITGSSCSRPTHKATIVRKLGAFGEPGYHFYLLNHGSPCRETPELLIDDGTSQQIYTTTVRVPSTEWTHVAVTVQRGAPSTVVFYVNGFAYPGVPTGPMVLGSLNNTEPVEIGSHISPTGSIDDSLAGSIDEVEIFRRVLRANEVASLYNADSMGKCKEFCQVDWDRSFYDSQTSIMVPAKICNNTNLQQIYNLTFHPVACPSGTMRSPEGITSDPGNPIAVPPYSCSTVWLTIPRPDFTAVGDGGCYEICMTNTNTGTRHCCVGSVQLSPPTIVVVVPASPVPPLLTGNPQQLGVPVRNEGNDRVVADYRIVVYRPDMLQDADAVSLDGQAPGEPLLGSIDLPIGATGVIEFSAEFVVDDPGQGYSVVIEMDIDGDGSLEPIESFSVINGLQDPCPPVITENFEFYIPETEPCGINNWSPWPGSTDVCGMVTTDEAASGMRSLKIDGAMGGATGLGDDMVQEFNLTNGRHVLTMQTLVPAGATGRGWVVLLSEFPVPFNWALNLMLDADAGVIRDEQDSSLTAPLVFGQWVELEVHIDLDADTVDVFYDGVEFIAGKSWAEGVPPSGPLTFQALDLYADEPGGSGTSGMFFDDISLRTVCEVAVEPDPCRADIDGDGTLTIFDFLAYQNLFSAGDPAADFDDDGQLTIFDFLLFQNEFSAGCPQST